MSLYVSQLYIYPIKSLMGIRVPNSKVEQRGLQYDRRWMLVDSSNRFISQRQESDLVFLQTSFRDDQLVITDRRTSNNYTVALEPELYKDRIMVEIWEDTVEACEIGSEANEWFSDVLKKDVKLVYMPEDTRRPMNPEWALGDEHVSFADAYPLLIIGEESVKDINSKITEEIEVIRFRPNIVISGGESYEEFLWKDMKIGEYDFRGLKPCARCKITTINPMTGEEGKEPLLTLSKQKINDKIVFGQHATVADPAGAVIREGDSVEIVSRKEEPFERIS